ncbi:putative DNA-binding domain-containing protein [Blastomonas sp.]|uniref:HvfC/BufC family peptide modification chaperone n=1 Tax=Blastomonas sp. TaxID=1909299 RepID=UPI00260817DB|nr:putative DNA-binding domain-containing protein [Blastomonas sp.]MDM7957251.1 putative DNA-binding domain-containing protein [Blastomonas sp.]
MSDLADDQARFVAVLQQGPESFPSGMFAGDPDRALLGLKAHANTISHARLVALEQTYPRTLAHVGAEAFNALSRDFIDLPAVRRRKLMGIGEGFADYLEASAANPLASGLAKVEWAWLQSYHAADVAALQLADLAQYDEARLLGMPVMPHPATRVVEIASAVAGLIPDLAARSDDTAAVLVTRPEETVRLLALGTAQTTLAIRAKNCANMGNLLQAAIETLGEAEALPAVFALIEAGALTRPGG